MCELFKRGKEIIMLLPYVVMFFTYLLFTLVTTGIVITIGYFISLKKFFDINEKIEEKA
jgi:hypothetical protein